MSMSMYARARAMISLCLSFFLLDTYTRRHNLYNIHALLPCCYYYTLATTHTYCIGHSPQTVTKFLAPT